MRYLYGIIFKLESIREYFLEDGRMMRALLTLHFQKLLMHCYLLLRILLQLQDLLEYCVPNSILQTF